MTTMGTLRRSISRQSLRYRTSTFPKTSGKFPSMFSVRNGSIRSHKRSQSNTSEIEKSTDTIDQIEEEETLDDKKQDTETEAVSQELKMLTSTINSYVEEDDLSSVPFNADMNGHNERYVDSELADENEPEHEVVITPTEHEKNKKNPFESELDQGCDVESSLDSVPIHNGIQSEESVTEDENYNRA